MEGGTVDHAEMVALIRNGVPAGGGTWADLGAGSGNFTRALAELLGPGSTIFAVDRNAWLITQLSAALARVPSQTTIVAKLGDFTGPLELPPLDGILMANALHFVRDQAGTLERVAANLRQ